MSSNSSSMMTPTLTPAAPPIPFLQTRPTLSHPFHSDASLLRCFNLFVPGSLHNTISADLTRLGTLVLSPEQIAHLQTSDANPPTLTHFDSFGHRVDRLHTSEGWRASGRIAAREGIVALGYDARYGAHARMYQFLKVHVWAPSSCGVGCPSAMQDGAASLLARHVGKEETNTPEATKVVLRRALERLLSRDPDEAWTSGQWMTERPGGSDVSRTETRARKASVLEGEDIACASDGSPLGPWEIHGYKWFSSATDANMTVLLAKTETPGSDPSTTRVSAFFAPLKVRRQPRCGVQRGQAEETLEYNGISIPRLKRKLGTRALPTAELSLQGTRAYLIGAEGQGTKEISAILNITRIHTAVGAIGAWGRGMAISKAFSHVRLVGGGKGTLLSEMPAHVKGLAEREVEYKANMLFTFFAVALLGAVEHPPSPGTSQSAITDAADAALLIPPPAAAPHHLLRLLTPVLKSTVALSTIAGLRFCMESLGGVGYLENEDPELNLARIFRDTCVLSIWEGTTDVLAADCVRVLRGRGAGEVRAAWSGWVRGAMERWGGGVVDEGVRGAVGTEMEELEGVLEQGTTEDLLYRGREVAERIAWVVCAVVLVEDAMRDGDEVAWEVARRWVGRKMDVAMKGRKRGWREESEWDRRIVFGVGAGVEAKAGARL